MCWIFIGRKENLRETLLNQKDRGLDSLGVISEKNTHRIVRSKYKGYKKYIRNVVEDEGLLIMHHRKATIWAITPENAHPFKWKHFQLMQNWTAQTFYNQNKLEYAKDTDTETLLSYIEDRTSKLEDVPSILEQLSNRLKEDLGIIIVVDNTTREILFYADWARESYIDLDYMNMKVNWIYNYQPNTNVGYENIWYIILDFNFNIIKNTFNAINKEPFYLFYSGVNSKYVDNTNHWYAYADVINCYDRESEMREAFSIHWGNTEYKGWDFHSLNKQEQIEYDHIVTYLTDEWANIYDMSIESAFTDYLTYYYWVDDMDSYLLYFEEELRLDKIFKIAYDYCLGD